MRTASQLGHDLQLGGEVRAAAVRHARGVRGARGLVQGTRDLALPRPGQIHVDTRGHTWKVTTGTDLASVKEYSIWMVVEWMPRWWKYSLILLPIL